MAVCGYDKSPQTNDFECHRLHEQIRIGDGDDQEEISAECIVLGYDCDTMINSVLLFGPDGKVFFCAIYYLGSWGDGTLTTCFSHTLRKGLVIIKYVSIKASRGVVMQLGF